MANHAYLASPRIPDADTLDQDFREFAKKFPPLEVRRHEDSWLITHEKTEGVCNAVHCWLHENNTFSLDGEVYKHVDSADENDKVIEFRHGHGPALYWWIECEFRAMLHEKYNCKACDDGIGEYDEETEHYDTLTDYLRATRSERYAEIELMFIKEWFEGGDLGPEWKELLGV